MASYYGGYLGSGVLGTFVLGDANSTVTGPLRVRRVLGSTYNIRKRVMATWTTAYRTCVFGVDTVRGEAGAQYRMGAMRVVATIGQHVRLSEKIGHTFAYRLPVRCSLSSQYRLRSIHAFDFYYSVRGRVNCTIGAQYAVKATDRVLYTLSSSFRLPLRTTLEGEGRFLERTKSTLQSEYAFMARMVSSAEFLYNIRQPVSVSYAAAYNIKDTNRVVSASSFRYALLDDSVDLITDSPTVVHKGKLVEITGARISFTEGSIAWSCSLDLANYEDYERFAQGDEFSVVVNGELFLFMIDSRERRQEDRSGALSMPTTLTGLGITARYQSPHAALVNETYSTAVSARSVVETLLSGATVHWNLMDWIIPPYRLAIVDESPAAAASRIVRAIGGVLEGTPDGEFVARSLFPIRVPDWATSIFDNVYTDADDNLQRGERVATEGLFNEYHVRDVDDAQGRDVIEFIPNPADYTTGTIRVYPQPVRAVVDLGHTGMPNITIVPLGQVSRQETEVVEFVAGTAATKYPITAIVSASWMANVLGGLTFEPGSNKLVTGTSDDYSLLSITYTTVSHDFRVTSPTQEQVQFLSGE